MANEEHDWKTKAILKQYDFYKTLGSRNYDEIEKTNLFLLKKKIGFATCGKPSEMPCIANYNTGYTEDQLIHIKSICDKVIEKSDNDPIKFACTILILYRKKSLCETAVFKITTTKGNIFIDAHARVYPNWKHFMENNKLPDCEYCYPLDGEYYTEKEFPFPGFAFSPASSLFSKATDCLDTAGSVASIAAAGVFAAGAFVTVAPVAMTAAGATALCTGAYSITRSVTSLYDRNKHEQSIGLKDQEARSAWLAVASSAVGVTQLAAFKGAQKICEGGRTLGKLGTFGLHALTTASLAFSGFGFVESLIICVDKYKKDNLTAKDVFDLSCELLFLFNAIASAKATSQLVGNMNAAVGESSTGQKKLTKTQKRNLRKRAAKRRAKGLQVKVNEETNYRERVGCIEISATMQTLLFEAIKSFAPRVQEVLYKCNAIGHDIMCWRKGEMTDLVCLKNLGSNLFQLYKNFKEDIEDAMTKVLKFFNSICDDILQYINKLFEIAPDEKRSVFCTKVVNAEDQMELLINEAERDIDNIHKSLGMDVSRVSSEKDSEVENLDDDDDNGDDDNGDDDDNLNPEAKQLLKSCGSVIDRSNLSCNDLEEFEDILDAVKDAIVNTFKTNVANYIKNLEAAKSASENNFDIATYHEKLGIQGDVTQHIFNETLGTLPIYQIKTKIKELKKKKHSLSTPVWESVTEGNMFLFFGPHGAGELSIYQLISLVNEILDNKNIDEKKISLTEGNYNLMEGKKEGVVMISMKENPDLQIVVYCGLTEENTASGMIVLVK